MHSMVFPHIAWLIFGFVGNFLFAMRFIWQWFQTEKARKSVIPDGFWYFSLGGGIIMAIYAIHLRDPVIIIGQCSGIVVYIRNLYFIFSEKGKNEHESSSD